MRLGIDAAAQWVAARIAASDLLQSASSKLPHRAELLLAYHLRVVCGGFIQYKAVKEPHRLAKSQHTVQETTTGSWCLVF